MFEIDPLKARPFLALTHIVHVYSLRLYSHNGLLRVKDGWSNAGNLAVVHTKQNKAFDAHWDDFAIPAESGCYAYRFM